jgi:peptidoglycan/LPS O-acetylase OafA/YrhL
MALLNTVSTTTSHAPLRPRSAHIAGLDGIRGLAVVLVLTYHLWPQILPGGFLGVTIFFALSGYLITRLLVEERERDGRIALRAFYVRRVRRLLPVAVGALGLIAVIWTVAGAMTRGLRREIGFSLLQLANWGQVTTGQRYGAADTASPVVHYWSLAIEEQIYLIVPILILLLSRRPLIITFAIAIAISGALTLAAQGDPVLVYYSTFTRASEFLFGALLAVIRLSAYARHQRRLAVLATLLLGGLILAATLVSVSTEFLYSGGLLIAGAAAAVAVWAVAHAPGFGALLDRRPLADLGRISYGLYVYHWPILLGLKMTGLADALIPWVTLWLTLLIATASARWVERPLQRSTAPITRLLLPLIVVAAGAFAVASFGASRDRSIDFETLAAGFEQRVAEIANVETARAEMPAAEPYIPAPPEDFIAENNAVTGPLTISYFGDSKALTLGAGLLTDPPSDWKIGPSFTELGCPIAREGDLRSLDLGPNGSRTLTKCDWMGFLEQAPRHPVEVLVVWFGTWDLTERRIPQLGEQWHTIESPAYQEYLLGEIDTFINAAHIHLEPELILVIAADDHHPAYPSGRAVLLNNLWAQYIAKSEYRLHLVDLATWIPDPDLAERLRPDGIHFTFGEPDPQDNTAVEFHQEWLDPLIRELLAEQRSATTSPRSPRQ